MDLLTLLGTAIALALDAFAVSAAVAATFPDMTGRHTFRLAFHFGLFQCLMPILGWIGGAAAARHLTMFDHWLAFALLIFLGLRMLWQSFSDEEERMAADPTRGWSLVMLSIATSVDAAAVGLSLGLLRVKIWLPSVVIGIVTGSLSVVGVRLGRRVGASLGRWAERVGGLVLIAIGLRILLSHLME